MKPIRVFFTHLLLLVVILGVPAAPSSAVNTNQPYTITDLGAWYPAAINNQRQVVGAGACAPAVVSVSYLWENGVLTCLNDPDGKILSARDINEQGQVLFSTSSLEPQYVWTDANRNRLIDVGEKQALPILAGYDRVMAWSMNDLSTVVGWSNIADSDPSIASAVSWTDGIAASLGGSGAYDINNNGIIVGLNGSAGVRWVNGVMSAMPSDFVPVAVNDRGEIIGYAYSPAQFRLNMHLWLPAPAYGLPAGMSDLGFPWYAGGSGIPADINEYGLIIGGGYYHWQEGQLTDVHTLLPPNSGWSNLIVEAINDHGDIVGRGNFNGQQRGFLLSPPRPAWTLLFYLDGDNDLGNSYDPIFERLELAADNPAVNVLVYWDNLPDNDSAYYHIQHDTDLTQPAFYTEGLNTWELGEAASHTPNTVSDFVIWAMENFPTEHYALLLSDHGSGLGGGLCEGNGSTANSCQLKMSLVDMQQALATVNTYNGKKIDVLYMDMCLMGMLEDAYQFRNLADYYVASQYLQWSFQEPYTNYVREITQDSTPEQVAILFSESYANVAASTSKPYTISAVRMAELQRLVDAVNSLAAALNSNMAEIAPTLTEIADGVQRFDNKAPRGITTADTYIDLYDFAFEVEIMLQDYPVIVNAAIEVQMAINAYIIHEAHASGQYRDRAGNVIIEDLSGSRGVAIFLPATASSFYKAENYDFAAGAVWDGAGPAMLQAADASWGSFLVQFFQATQPDGPDDPEMPLPIARLEPNETIFLPLVLR